MKTFRLSVLAGLLASLASLAPAQTVTMPLWGNSMLPVLPYRSTQKVDVSPAAFAKVRLGSVIVFRNNRGHLTSHAVFKAIKPGVWWTRGVNNKLPDSEYVSKDNFVGVVIGVEAPVKGKKK